MHAPLLLLSSPLPPLELTSAPVTCVNSWVKRKETIWNNRSSHPLWNNTVSSKCPSTPIASYMKLLFCYCTFSIEASFTRNVSIAVFAVSRTLSCNALEKIRRMKSNVVSIYWGRCLFLYCEPELCTPHSLEEERGALTGPLKTSSATWGDLGKLADWRAAVLHG